jgi:hypothetical protein
MSKDKSSILKLKGPIPDPPALPDKRIINEDVSKAFLKGMLVAFLILILVHIGIAYMFIL